MIARVAVWIVAGLLAGCLGLLLLPRRNVQSHSLALLRCFFPSWRFFEEIDPGPTLRVSSALPDADFSPWREAWVAQPRTAAALILNARGNLELAYQSLVDQLWSELGEEAGAPHMLTSYQLIQRLIEVECLAPAERVPGARYRFQIISTEPESSDAFESTEHEASG